ncbi:MAM and LDL-receptor class A domain-containing protein 1-like, partial [Diadema antillarum]|uniref:MAM and LDL-receptor class A domain-containing protein 1-like n=1 Tax=Diadema antillarum TaxID=105358 RepID=UPI003A8463E7
LSIEAKDNMDNANTGGYAIDDMRFVDCAYTFPWLRGGSCEADEEMCDSNHCYPKYEKCDLTLNCCDGTDELLSNCVEYNQCDFESGWCEWEQLTDDDRDWTRRTGTTGTSNTGPARDHTTASGSGYYIYTEANDALPGDTYRIGSFYIQGNSADCKQGLGIGMLSVLTRTQIGGPMTRKWLTVDPHGDYWLYESIDLDGETADFQVIIEGIRGDSNVGDIAVDDISFTPGCVKSNDPLPDSDATPTPGVTCPSGQRPCDDETCIDEAKYCDFNIDCAKLGDDEAYCPSVCDFDLDFCYWSQDVNDDFDWSWFDAPSMSDDYQGPGTDHTSGSNLGHYIFVDGTTSRINTRAKLISPIYKNSARGCTFSMFYYMFGLEYGDLEVRLLTLDDGQDTNLRKVSDDLLDYNKWIEATVTIPACIGRFQVVIDAEDRQRIPSEGGFAVDDVKFTDCAFEQPDETGSCSGLNTAQCHSGECYHGDRYCDFTVDCCDGSDEIRVDCESFGYTLCDFEDGFCGWSQMTTDEFDWTRHQGDTGSENTGPAEDHTTGTPFGFYIYTEVSNRRIGDRAKLVSIPLQATSVANACGLRFYYHMVGGGIGELGVYTRTAINGPMSLEWSRDQPNEDAWIFQTVDIRSNEDFEIIFMGTKGATAYGDISLDDISLTPGCEALGSSLPLVTTPPSSVFCDFEDEHMCYWTHDDANDFDWALYCPHDGAPVGFKGPETDHTSFTAAGHYIYVDGTTSERDQRARLVSPLFKKARRGCIFSMWYYMFGAEYGDLEVRLLTADSDIRLTKADDDINDYNEWLRHQTEIPPCTTNFQIVLDAEDRQLIPNTEGGFAVDDMLFQDCAYPAPVADGACGVGEAQCEAGECYPAAQTCDFTADCCDGSDELRATCIDLGYSMCDFEADQCEGDWEQLTTDEFDWRRENGRTGSDDTGPDHDHTTGSGYYLYTEASNPMRNGDRAQLASFTISRTLVGQCEVRFFYHMKGKGIGTLNVYTRTAINGPLSLLWSEDRQVGGDWTYKALDISSTQDFQIILEGVIGYTIEGDIGLDDISLTPQCERSANSLPVISTTKPGTPVNPTASNCGPGFYQCPSSKACIDDGQVCDGLNDCSLGEDEEDCYNPKNKSLIIGLSVTFGILAIVCAAALAFYLVNRQRSVKKP